MSFDKLAENRIREAMKNGEFDNIAGKGRPVDLESYFALPEDVRMAYTLLKNANCAPEDVTLMNEVARLRRIVETASDPAAREAAAASLREQELRLNVLRDSRKRPPSPRRRRR